MFAVYPLAFQSPLNWHVGRPKIHSFGARHEQPL